MIIGFKKFKEENTEVDNRKTVTFLPCIIKWCPKNQLDHCADINAAGAHACCFDT